MPKSGSVSRQRPRSRPTTCNPASASSLARMVPLRPTPTTTASTGFNRVAMSVLSHQKHMLGMAVLVEHRFILQNVEDRHRQRVVWHAVLLDVLRIDGRYAREAHQLPADLLAVAAVDRIGEEAFDGVVEKQAEEKSRRHRLERKLALFERMQHLVLLRGGELVEGFAVLLRARRIDVGNRGAVGLLRRERRLIALLRRAFGVRSLAVHLRHRAPAAEELLVDEIGDARLLRPGAEFIGGNEARHRGVEESDLGGAQKHVLLALRRAVRVCLRYRLCRNARRAEGADRLQETASTS